jgi:spore coat protein U-like protein
MRDGFLGFFGTPLLYEIRRDSHTGAVIERDYNNAIGYVVLDTPSGPGNSSHRGSISMTLYGTIVPGQSGLPGGQYLDVLVQGQVRSSTDLSPSTGCVGDPDDTFSLAAYAQVEESCTIIAEPLRFGTHYDLSGNIASSAGLGLTCTADTAYTITLDGGDAGNPGARQMRLNGVGPQVINYGLYQDSGHDRPWGNQLATSVQGTGTGTPATLTVYGLVPGGQPAPAIGTYTDTVTVTVEY